MGSPWLARGLVKLVPAVAYHLCSIYLQHSCNHVRTIKGCPVWRSAKREVLYRWFSEICSPSCLAFRKKLHRRSQTVFEVIFFPSVSLLIWFKMSTEIDQSICSRLRELCRPVEAEVVSNSRSRIHQTWSIDFSRSLTC